MDLSGNIIKGTGSYSVQELSAQDSVLKHLEKGTKYLLCDSSGTVAFKSDMAYGEWEFDIWKDLDTNQPEYSFISTDLLGGVGSGYEVLLTSDERLRINRSAAAVLIGSAVSYIELQRWYRLKITRTLDSEFYFYVRGGSFGDNDWTLVDVTGGNGTNPVIDSIYSESQYFVLNLDVGDKIANITTRKAVSQ